MGRHNIYNALACVSAARLVGIDAKDIAAGLLAFRGAARRMEARGSLLGAQIFDDYAHHPTEIATTLRGVREMARGRLICVYQPHTYSRTAALFDEFCGAFESANRVILLDIYAAREIDDGRVSSEKLAAAIGERAVFGGSFERTAELLTREIREGDTVVVMGAGDTHRLFERLPIEADAKG
jgi:UDP-N-acetylmuramate--alanine ligase